MGLITNIKNLANYNSWANIQLILWLQNLSEINLNQPVKSSFSTIKLTLLHIWNAEKFWLSFLQNKPSEKFVESYEGNVDVFLNSITKQSIDLENYILSLNEEKLNEIVSIDTPWLKGDQPCSTFIYHVFNHSTYHRGQLITMGRGLGLVNPPNTDFSKFVINQSKTK